jgi:hypothetical protein
MKSSFEAAFPNIIRWVKGFGTVEMGYDPGTDSFIRAMDEGGMPWSGKSRYETVDDAFQDLENGISATIGTRKRSAKRRVSSKPSRTTKTPDQRKRKPPEDLLPRQVRKLDEIVEAIRRKENVQVTRLTVVKKLCENPNAAGAFAMFLARKGQKRLREKQGKQRYRELANRAVREMKAYLDEPSEDQKERLWSLLLDIESEQNEYESVRWGAVRKIKCWDLLIVEKALRTILRTDEAPYSLYQAARDYVESSMFLEKASILPPGNGRLDVHDPRQPQALGIEPGHCRRCWHTGGSTDLWHLAHLANRHCIVRTANPVS